MIWILEIALRSSVVVLAGLAAAALLRHRSAAVRHWVLAMGIFGAVAVLPLSRALPGWDLPVAATAPIAATTAGDQSVEDVRVVVEAAPVRQEGLDLARLTTIIWASGVAISFAVMLVSGARLWRVRLRAVPVGSGAWHRVCQDLTRRYALARPVSLLETDTTHALGTWGLLRPRVLLPRQAATWTADRVGIVLGHELAHVRRGDWLVQVLADCVRAVFWFNPLFWIACAELRRESEHACDDIVLETGVAAADYAAHLVDIARACRPMPGYSPAMSMARPSTLERRVTAMLNHRLDRTHVSSRTKLLILLLLAGIAVPTASFRAAAQSAPTLSGTVYDSTGAVLPQVDVTLEDQQSVRRRVTTDSGGRFEFDQVSPGHYVLDTSLPGFRPAKQEFDLGQSADWTRSITLQVGTLEEIIRVTAARPSGIVPAEPGRPIGGNIKVPRKLVDVKPIYPASMRESGLEGKVVLEAQIGVDGTVLSARTVSAQVHPDFANAAIDAVKQWRFSPTLLNGSPIEVSMRVSVSFNLSEEQ